MVVGYYGTGPPGSLQGHVTMSDGSVGIGSMGAGFVWLDRSKCGSEGVGREEEFTSSGRTEIGAYAARDALQIMRTWSHSNG